MLIFPKVQSSTEVDTTKCTGVENHSGEKTDSKKNVLLKNKLRLLHKLAYESAAAKRVENSEDDKAIALLNSARESYTSSGNLVDQGCTVEAEDHINNGLHNIQGAYRQVEDDKRTEELARQAYEQSSERLKTFRKSFDSVVQSRGSKAADVVDEKVFDGLVRQAHSHEQDNNYRQAANYLEKAVGMLEAGLAVALDKETIVHEFKFDSVEDEYNYVHETNQSYVRLLNLVIEKLDKGSGKYTLISNLIKHNEDVIAEADANMANGKIEDALKNLEQGNIELIRAMSITGIGQ